MSGRGGFALPLALAVMFAASIMVVTGLQVALADFQANRGTRLAAKALYVAEAGAQRTVASWGTGPFGTLVPGDSASTGWVSLPDGSQYQSVVMRVDDASGATGMYRVRTVGRPSRVSTARRTVVTMVADDGAADLCCDGAITMRGRLVVRAPRPPRGRGRGGWTPPAQIDGRDHIPAAWAGYCPVADPDVAGIHIERSRNITFQQNAWAEGTPAVWEDASIDGTLADALGTTTYDDLVARADLTLNAGARIRNAIRPSASGGACDTSDGRNWGAPEVPGSVCWDYLPIIHADGNLRIQGGGQGQGVLLVDGNLTVSSDFDFYGLIVVKGQLVWRTSGTLTGGAIVANRANGNGRSQVRDAALLRYSSCAACLAGRYWFETS